MTKDASTPKNNPIVKLKNGLTAPKSIIDQAYANIVRLKDIGVHSNISALTDLYNKAQDSSYEITDNNSRQILYSQGFITKDGYFFPYIQDIVLSSIKIEDFTPKISDPIAKPTKKSSLKESFLRPILYHKSKSDGNSKESTTNQEKHKGSSSFESNTLDLPRSISFEKFFPPSPLSKARSKSFEILTNSLGENSDSGGDES